MTYINKKVTIHFPVRMVESRTPTLEFECPRCDYEDEGLKGLHHISELLASRKNRQRVSSFTCPSCKLDVIVYGEGDDAMMEAEYV